MIFISQKSIFPYVVSLEYSSKIGIASISVMADRLHTNQ